MTPAFVTLTGADHAGLIPHMQRLSARYPGFIEWGILIGLSPAPRFADGATLDAMRRSGLRLSAHLCGPLAQAIFDGQSPAINLSGFTRVQVNKPEGHATLPEVEAALRFGQQAGRRIILQCAGPFPDDPRCDWLLDRSHGRGRPLTQVPDLGQSRALCGFSGGISPLTVRAVLAQITAPGRAFWLDSESALQDKDGFSIAACEGLIQSILEI